LLVLRADGVAGSGEAMTEVFFRRTTQALSSEVGADIVALNIARGSCYAMEGVSATVWQLLADAVTPEQLCDRLLETYDVDAQTCRNDVSALLRELEDEGLIERTAAN
jgi:hypothetical protein